MARTCAKLAPSTTTWISTSQLLLHSIAIREFSSNKKSFNDDNTSNTENLKLKPLRSNLVNKLGLSSIYDNYSEYKENSSNWNKIFERCITLLKYDGGVLHLNSLFYGTNVL